ncbi:hypothetical protein RSOLAG22IIIB_08925 [Rhizoctonia solani]|uniref:RraA-like protein n=1 Tax=Rhizoctonia solani TaxID=456999 RepID=A0A0K6FW36_9AGAM|nr:hypothetical protein RSOLAG22IIIB_08925 [Rhizoctonia solani]
MPMPDPSNFDVWIWSSSHPEQPSRSRPNTRAPNKFSRATRRRADPSAVSSPDSPFLSCCSSLSSIASILPDYNSTSSKQKLNVGTRKDVSSMGSRSSLLQRFEQYSTGEVLYALIALGLTQDPKASPIQHGGLLPDVYMLSPLSINPLKQAHQICGFAYTIEMAHPDENVNFQHSFETVSNENIIISSPSSDIEYTVWDKSMTVNARNQGVRGAIVNGLTTDLTTHREVGFSVFSQGYSPPGRAVAASPSRTNIPVTFSPRSHFGTYFKDSLSAVEVYPGDIIVADVGGAVCVPFASAEEVLNMCAVQAQSTLMVAKSV